jgi:hypothetical protein
MVAVWLVIGASSAFGQTDAKTPDGEPKLKYHAPSVASDPGQVDLSLKRLFALAPELAPPKKKQSPAEAKPDAPQPDAPSAEQPKVAPPTAAPVIDEDMRVRIVETLKEHMRAGDSRAAVVISTDPLLVAAYTDELDCVAMLQFPKALAKMHKLKVGSRLLTVNVYPRAPAADLEPGPKDIGRYGNFFPIIAEFVTDRPERCEMRKLAISEDEWLRCESMGDAYHKNHPTWIRNGSPIYSLVPSKAAK